MTMEMNLNSSLLFIVSMIFITFILNYITKKKLSIEKKSLESKTISHTEKDFKIIMNKWNNRARFIDVENEKNYSDQNSVSLLTYNILCQKFAESTKKGKSLSAEKRIGVILNELTELNADILCLQEVNHEILNLFLIKFFITNRYYFMYGRNEGSKFLNVIAYKNKKFSYASQKNFELSLDGHNKFFIGNRGVFRLELKMSNNERIIIYNVHFPWRPHLEFQKSIILGYIFEDIYKNYYSSSSRIFICGDFNSLPDSLVLKMMYFDLEKKFFEENFHKIKDKLPILSSDIKTLQFLIQIIREEKEKKCYERILKVIESVNRNFRFRSAFENYKILNNSLNSFSKYSYVENHPEFTNFSRKFHGNIDYIFYSNNILVKKILSLPSINDINRESTFPNERFPSDHIKIYAEFLLE